MGVLLGEAGGMQEGSGNGHLFPWGPHWETWEWAHMPGAYVWKKVLEGVSQSRSASSDLPLQVSRWGTWGGWSIFREL